MSGDQTWTDLVDRFLDLDPIAMDAALHFIADLEDCSPQATESDVRDLIPHYTQWVEHPKYRCPHFKACISVPVVDFATRYLRLDRDQRNHLFLYFAGLSRYVDLSSFTEFLEPSIVGEGRLDPPDRRADALTKGGTS